MSLNKLDFRQFHLFDVFVSQDHAVVRKLGAKIVTTTFSFLGSVADVFFVV